MYVSDWLKRPNMVPRPNLSGDSISPHHAQGKGYIGLCTPLGTGESGF